MTLEEAQAEIVRLNDEIAAITADRDTLSENNKTLTEDNDRLRKINQRYYNKLEAQFPANKDKNNIEDKEVQSCEDFAKTINI